MQKTEGCTNMEATQAVTEDMGVMEEGTQEEGDMQVAKEGGRGGTLVHIGVVLALEVEVVTRKDG